MLLTGDLHFLGFLASPEYEPGSFEDAINDVRLLLHAVIGHLAFAVRAQDDKNGSFGILDLRSHLDVGFCAVVEHSQGR